MITDPPRVEGFELRALSEADAPDLLALFSDPEVCAFMDIEPLLAEAEALDIIDWAEAQAAQGLGVRWGIRRAGEGRLIGTVGFNRIERGRGRTNGAGGSCPPSCPPSSPAASRIGA